MQALCTWLLFWFQLYVWDVWIWNRKHCLRGQRVHVVCCQMTLIILTPKLYLYNQTLYWDELWCWSSFILPKHKMYTTQDENGASHRLSNAWWEYLVVPIFKARRLVIDTYEDEAWPDLLSKGQDGRGQLLWVTQPLAMYGTAPDTHEASVCTGTLR